MKKLVTFGLLVVLIIYKSNVVAQDFAQISEFVEHSKQVFDMPSGTAIAVVEGNKVIYEGYFGFEDIEAQKKVNSETGFYIASSTKPFFALATLLKINNGELETKTSLQSLFPDAEFNTLNAQTITVKDLLTHTSGIDNQPMVWTSAYSGTHDLAVRNKLVEASYNNSETPPGKFNYSNTGYNILSVWFENTDETLWQDTLSQTVLSPLGMSRTSAYMSDARRNHWAIAKPYLYSSENRKTPLYLTKKDNTMHSAGGLISTANDLARFITAQINEGRVDGKQVFPKNVIQRSQQLQAKVNNSKARFPREGYAWGWYVGEYMGARLYHHFGGFPGAAAHVSFMPDRELGVIILNNESRLHSSNMLSAIFAEGIYTLLLNQDKSQKKIREQVGTLLSSELRSLKEMVEQGTKSEQKNIAKRAQREWQLSLNRQAYAGTYVHELVGEITVSQFSQKALKLDWGNLTSVATAFRNPESIRVELVPGRGDVVEFTLDGERVESLTLDGMLFEKK